MTTDERMDAAGEWCLVREGIKPIGDGTAWWRILQAIFDNIGTTYALDYLWWVATGQRDHGMAERQLPDHQFIMDTRTGLAKLGALLPPNPPTEWQ